MSNTKTASTILITGGAGNIGSALSRGLAENTANQIIVLDNLSTGSANKVPVAENITLIKGDVNNYEDVAAVCFKYDIEHIFHFAAVVGVERTLANPLLVLEDIKGIENVLNLAKNTGVKRVYYSSSSEVYGEPFEIPQNEATTPLNSRLPYAIVKNLGEAYFKTYQQEFDLNYTIFRFFNTYGPNQSEDFVLPRFVRLALANKPISIYGDGSQTRTFSYVDDSVEACLKAHYNQAHINDTLNVGNDQEITILELAKTVIKVTKSQSTINHLPPLPEGDMTRRCPDITKMKKLLGRSVTDLAEGVLKLIGFWDQNSHR